TRSVLRCITLGCALCCFGIGALAEVIALFAAEGQAAGVIPGALAGASAGREVSGESVAHAGQQSLQVFRPTMR
ncbi:MAG: hypothetical protein AAGL92_06075, partial [Pseudomonadota bacterium]